MEAQRVIIGLDVGTTAVKAVAFGIGSSRRASAAREYPLIQPQAGWQVQDPQRIAAAVVSALAECVAACGDAQVLAVSLSTAMHGLIGLDADGRPMTPLVTWADGRALAQSAGLRKQGLDSIAYRISGVPNHPMSPLPKLIWFGQTEPELAGRVHSWVGLKDFVLLTLTGTLATELSSATGTGLLDLRSRSWSPVLLELAGVRLDQLPPILSPTDSLPLADAVAAATGLPPGLPVVAGAADGPLGNLATGSLAAGVVGLSIGTSGALRLGVPEPVFDPGEKLFCFALTADQWVLGSAISNGGSVLRWIGNLLADPSVPSGGNRDADLLALAASVPAGSDGLVMLPYLLAERGPLWDPTLPGALLGLRHRHTRAHLVRAAVEGVALQLSVILDGLDELSPITAVHATGGVFRSPLWQQVMADALNRPLLVTDGEAGTALGAAALGLVSLGLAADPEAGVAMLAPPTADRAYVQPQQPEVYRQLRASIPALLAGYRELASVFER
ncbi:MAG: gluconokinase [Micropruina sp.]|nr:gluconokinase [Micropruina sp.]